MAVFEGESKEKKHEIAFLEIIMRYKSVQKPKNCPKCGSGRIADILYGLPAFSEELQKDLDEGRVVLGGCCVSGGEPEWECGDCGAEIYLLKRQRKKK